MNYSKSLIAKLPNYNTILIIVLVRTIQSNSLLQITQDLYIVQIILKCILMFMRLNQREFIILVVNYMWVYVYLK